MDMTGNTILITGGGSGIGLGLAKALAENNTIIIAGRRRDVLEKAAAGHASIRFEVLDVEDPKAIRSFAEKLVSDYPALNVVIHNAGIMRVEDIKAGAYLDDAEAMVTTNLLGPIRLTQALLPHLLKQKASSIINVTSGLAFVPLAATPTYSATKAALHSYSQGLRSQLRDTSVRVIEIAPPAVATELMPGHDKNPLSMPLDEYISETIGLLAANPDAEEILVERVKFLRNAESSGQFDQVFAQLNAH